jgi:phospho-N-acetylmuramoyl-pentapeptide-transferase
MLSKPILLLLARLKSRQTVSQYAPEGHQIKQGTPTMGGLIVLCGMLAGPWMSLGSGRRESIIIPYTALVIGFALIGFIDDYAVPRLIPGKRGLGWKQKLVMQFALATPFVATGFNLYSALAVVVILFFANAYNFADGLDGLSGSLGVLLCVGLGGLSLVTQKNASDLPIVAAIAGAFLPFLWWNAPPARVFMGDVGSLPIGAALGVIALSLGDPAKQVPSSSPPLIWISLGVLSLVMVAELVPVPLQIFWVKVFKKRLFSYTPIHHAFEKKGWPESRVVWSFALVQCLFAAIAISIALGSQGAAK